MTLKTNPFAKALESFKAEKTTRNSLKEMSIIEVKEDTAGDNSEKNQGAENNPPDELEKRKKETEVKEDEELFQRLLAIIQIEKGSKQFFAVRKLITESRRRDVTYDINRWFRIELGKSSSSDFKEIINLVLKRGYEAEAISWLKSTTPEGMKYGTASRAERFKKAKETAQEAGASLEEIASKNNIPLE